MFSKVTVLKIFSLTSKNLQLSPIFSKVADLGPQLYKKQDSTAGAFQWTLQNNSEQVSVAILWNTYLCLSPNKHSEFKVRGSPASIYLLKVNIINTRRRWEIYSNLTIKTPETRQWRRSGVFIVKIKYTSHLALVFLLLTSNIIAGWEKRI